MDVIDISSTDSEDDLWDDDDDLEEEIDRLPPNSQPRVNPDNGSNLILHDIGNYALVDNAGPSTEHIHKSSTLKRCTPTQRVSPSTENAHSGSILTSSGQRMYYGSNPEQMLDGTVKDMGNVEIEPSTYEKFIPPLKPTVDRENGSGQDAGDSGNCMWKDGVEPSKEHIQRRTLPPSILPIAHPKHGFHLTVNESNNNNSWQGKGNSSKDNIMASRQATFVDGDADAKYGDSTTDSPDCETKLSMDSTQKRILPSSLQPTILKFAPKASLENNDDIQVLGSRRKLGSFEEAKVTKLTYPKFNIKDNIDRKSDPIYENAGAHRQLPSWMSGGSVSEKIGIISSTGTLPSYLLDRTGDHSSIGERSMEEDERLIFQAALQDLAQPKYEVDLSAGLLTVPLLRHQRIALAWMQRKETSLHCSGGILADDQGLGKTISVIALIQMERPHQVQFSCSLSSYIRFDALNLEVADHIIPEDKKTRHFEENLGVRPQESNLPYDHSGHTASEVLNLVEIDDERHALDGHVGADWGTKAVKSETSGLDKLDLPLPKMKEADHSAESKSSKKAQAKNSVKSTMYKGRPAGGTLIVCPASILRQWSRELDEKVPVDSKLSVLIYHGSARSKDPSFLAQYDVVLTTYAIVTNEVPKQPLSVDDDGERRNTENFALSSDFSIQKKRKKTSDVHKRGKKKKNGACDSSFDYDSGPLARVRWFRVVLDEAQMIKNYRTQVSRACCGLRAKRRWCLSGTPLQNSLDDLYSYFRFLKYDPYAVYSSFCSSIKNPITRNAKTGYRKLQAVLRTIMLRRTKGSLIDGEPIIKLPPKEICLKKIYFSAEEREFYSNLEADSRQKFKAFAAAGTVNENYASILALLLRLRQACDHPRLVKEYHSSPVASASLRRAQQLPTEMLTHLLNRLEASLAICGICSDQPEDAIVTMCGHVFCYQCVSVYLTGDDNICPAASCKDTLDADSIFSGLTLRNCMSGELVEYSSGGVKHPDPSFHSSSKIEAAMDILKSICIGRCPEAIGERCDKRFTSPHESIMTSFEVHAHSIAKSSEAKPAELPLELPIKAIVFSQWTSMLDLFQISLNHSLIQYRRLDGTMSLVSRDRAVKDFNSDPEVTVMLMSLKAGNLGLNMIAACHVILLDPWWNPTTEDQAIDRAHRIGQIRPVTVSRLTVSGTVEDRILALQEKKREMVSFAFGEDQTAGRSTRLTAEDLRYLFNV